MNKRRTAPVVERSVSGVRQQMAHRMRLLQDVKRMEWEFDRQPTLQIAGRLSNLRTGVSEIEAEIAEASEEASVQAMLSRVNAIAEHADRAGDS